MEKKDLPRFRLAMNKTRISLPGPALDDKEKALRVEVFWEELQGNSIEEVEGALQHARSKLRFFPTVIELNNFMREQRHQKYLSQINIEESKFHSINWMEPTEEGKRKAKELIQKLYDRWEREDKKELADREKRFRERKKILENQKKLLGLN